MKTKKRLKRLEERIRELEAEVFGELEIEFEPDPYLLDPNAEVREDILKEADKTDNTDTDNTGHSAAGGGEVGQEPYSVSFDVRYMDWEDTNGE